MQDLDLFLEECDRLSHRDAPDHLLWHYTSIESLISIAKSQVVRLTCYSFLNDPAEGQRFDLLLTVAWNAAIDAVGGHERFDINYIRDISATVLRAREQRDTDTETFLFSLSELGDSLSQWARYGGDGAGVALGFKIDPQQFAAPLQTPWSYGPFLHKVLYDWLSDASPGLQPELAAETAKFKERLTELIRSFVATIKFTEETDNAVFVLLETLRAMFKQNAYHEEREWRLATYTTSDSDDLYDFRSTPFGLAPFMTVPLGPGLQLKEIRLGPKLTPENARTTAWLCRKYKLDASVSRSAFAYR
jgi:hypothetical protein